MAEKPTYEELERRLQELELIESKYKSSKEALQENESLFKLLYEKAPLGYQSLDETGHFIVVNQTWLDTLGYKREEVIGKSFADFLHPNWRDHFKENFPRFKSIGEILGVEFEMVKKNGAFILVSFTGKISRDEKGNFQQTHCIFHDITERKKHEESLERYKNIVSSTTDAIAYLDENYRYIIVNNAYENFSGAKLDDFIGMTVAEYMGKEVFEEKIKSNLDRCFNGEIVNYQEWFEYPTKGKRFVDVTYFPYRDGENHISGVIASTRDITERKKVEESLNRERTMLARTEAMAHVGSWEWEAEDDKVTWSEELFRIFGLEPMAEAPPFKDHQAFYVPEDRVRLVEAVEECMRNSVPYDLEVSFKRTDGQLRHCIVRGIPELNADGTVNRLYGSLQDITDRKRMEEALRESEERIRTIGDNLQGAQIYQLRVAPDGGTSFTYVSSKVEDLHECKPEDILKDASLLFKRVHPADVDEWQKRTQKSLRELITYDHTLRIVRKSGEIRWHRMISTPRKLNDGSVLFDGVELDVTERKQWEEALRESEERFKCIFNDAPMGIAIVDSLNAEFYLVNPALARITGRSREELERIDWESITHPDDIQPDKDNMAAMNAGKIPGFQMEKRYMHADGKYFWVNITVAPMYVADKSKLRHLLMVEDITKRKQAETDKEKLQTQLAQSQKIESVGRLAGGVAHDFNNMLGVILGHTELALLQADENHDLHADLNEIQKAATRSADLVKKLLAFARKQTISPRRLDLNDTVENMLNMLRRLIGEDIDLVWQPSSDQCLVKMDPSQIDQILANLCINARDAIAGVGKLTIETEKKSFDKQYCTVNPGFIPGNFVLLTVSDNGCGMDKEILDNLFEPFFTTKDVGKGTGLGLATIYGIVKQNNGFINVYSEPGKGSTFNIYLPQLVAEEDSEKAVSEKKAAAGGTETILLVEDEPSILRMTRMMLERKGYTVLAATTPAEAVKKAKNHSDSIDLLMTDVIMPEMNGRDLATKITALYPGISLLFMSGYTADVIANQGMLDAKVAFIQKPFSMADMTEKVREVLDTASDQN
ncbi:MAG: PAS domain S-box protein [Desulfotignum sp.]|jgi:PAS domain S-box-containing protein|nr:PAS domain S-box protein [Desulfotignum sp.]